jgi:hypothetical protein
VNATDAVPNVKYISEQKRFKNLETKQSVYKQYRSAQELPFDQL